jgi:hypothetical protein
VARRRAGPRPPLPRRRGAVAPGRLLDSFAALHPAAPAWQREQAALLIGGPLVAAFLAAGFVETSRQHEMAIEI